MNHDPHHLPWPGALKDPQLSHCRGPFDLCESSVPRCPCGGGAWCCTGRSGWSRVAGGGCGWFAIPPWRQQQTGWTCLKTVSMLFFLRCFFWGLLVLETTWWDVTYWEILWNNDVSIVRWQFLMAIKGLELVWNGMLGQRMSHVVRVWMVCRQLRPDGHKIVKLTNNNPKSMARWCHFRWLPGLWKCLAGSYSRGTASFHRWSMPGVENG